MRKCPASGICLYRASFLSSANTVNDVTQVQRELESQLQRLRDELLQTQQLRKEQLLELGLLREEEKQKMTRDHEQQVLSVAYTARLIRKQ